MCRTDILLRLFPPSSNAASARIVERVLNPRNRPGAQRKCGWSQGTSGLCVISISGPSPSSFGYGSQQSLFTTLHYENLDILRIAIKRAGFATASRWHRKTYPSLVVDIRPGQGLRHKIISNIHLQISRSYAGSFE